jgi:hypothetical protein
MITEKKETSNGQRTIITEGNDVEEFLASMGVELSDEAKSFIDFFHQLE